MKSFDRRNFLKTSLLSAAALSLSGTPLAAQAGARPAAAAARSNNGGGLVDTNVNVSGWPYRRLKYAETSALVGKLKRHGVTEAWTGSFEALLHKDIDGVNARLAEECRSNGGGILVPFGTVNLAWPDWEEDLRRCHEVYGMPGIRVYPGYQPFDPGQPEFARLLQATAERGLILQVAMDMEDPRVHHPTLVMRRPDTRAMMGHLLANPTTRVQFLHWGRYFRGGDLATLVGETDVVWDISNLEGNGGVGRLIDGKHWFIQGQVPVNRLLFGSHAPYFPVENALLKLMESPLSAVQLEYLTHRNARRLIGGEARIGSDARIGLRS